MNKMSQLMTVLAGSCLFFSTVEADQTEAAARASCKCLEPVHEMANQVQAAMKSGDNAKMMEISKNMENNTEIEACMDKVFAKYESIANDQAQSDKVEMHMRKLCPSPMPQMPGR